MMLLASLMLSVCLAAPQVRVGNPKDPVYTRTPSLTDKDKDKNEYHCICGYDFFEKNGELDGDGGNPCTWYENKCGHDTEDTGLNFVNPAYKLFERIKDACCSKRILLPLARAANGYPALEVGPIYDKTEIHDECKSEDQFRVGLHTHPPCWGDQAAQTGVYATDYNDDEWQKSRKTMSLDRLAAVDWAFLGVKEPVQDYIPPAAKAAYGVGIPYRQGPLTPPGIKCSCDQDFGCSYAETGEACNPVQGLLQSKMKSGDVIGESFVQRKLRPMCLAMNQIKMKNAVTDYSKCTSPNGQGGFDCWAGGKRSCHPAKCTSPGPKNKGTDCWFNDGKSDPASCADGYTAKPTGEKGWWGWEKYACCPPDENIVEEFTCAAGYNVQKTGAQHHHEGQVWEQYTCAQTTPFDVDACSASFQGFWNARLDVWFGSSEGTTHNGQLMDSFEWFCDDAVPPSSSYYSSSVDVSADRPRNVKQPWSSTCWLSGPAGVWKKERMMALWKALDEFEYPTLEDSLKHLMLKQGSNGSVISQNVSFSQYADACGAKMCTFRVSGALSFSELVTQVGAWFGTVQAVVMVFFGTVVRGIVQSRSRSIRAARERLKQRLKGDLKDPTKKDDDIESNVRVTGGPDPARVMSNQVAPEPQSRVTPAAVPAPIQVAPAPVPAPIQQAPAPVPVPIQQAPAPVPEQRTVLFCTGCGAPRQEGAAFCKGCGKQNA